MTEKRFTADEGLENVLCWEINDKENEDMTCGECAKLLNELHEENQVLKRHIERNTFKKIRVEDILDWGKYDKFYDNKEAIKSIDWIAEQLGVDLE